MDKNPLFNDWPIKWRKTLALSFMKRDMLFDDVLFKQGDEADKLFFVIRLYIQYFCQLLFYLEQNKEYLRIIGESDDFCCSGEIRLTCEPEGHKTLFKNLIDSCYLYFLEEK